MKEYVQHDYGVPAVRQIVIPCCPDVAAFGRVKEARAFMRAQLGVENRFVVAYCGGLSPWQLPTLCLDVFREIQKNVPEAHFLALTTEDRAMRNLAASQGLSTKRTTVLRVRHSDVPRYLAAPTGTLLREASLSIEISSPVNSGVSGRRVPVSSATRGRLLRPDDFGAAGMIFDAGLQRISDRFPFNCLVLFENVRSKATICATGAEPLRNGAFPGTCTCPNSLGSMKRSPPAAIHGYEIQNRTGSHVVVMQQECPR